MRLLAHENVPLAGRHAELGADDDLGPERLQHPPEAPLRLAVAVRGRGVEVVDALPDGLADGAGALLIVAVGFVLSVASRSKKAARSADARFCGYCLITVTSAP